MINKNILSRIVQENLEVRLNNSLTQQGYSTDSTRKLFRFISNIFTQLPPELISWRFRVVFLIGQHEASNKAVMHMDNFKDLFNGECSIIILNP